MTWLCCEWGELELVLEWTGVSYPVVLLGHMLQIVGVCNLLAWNCPWGWCGILHGVGVESESSMVLVWNPPWCWCGVLNEVGMLILHFVGMESFMLPQLREHGCPNTAAVRFATSNRRQV